MDNPVTLRVAVVAPVVRSRVVAVTLVAVAVVSVDKPVTRRVEVVAPVVAIKTPVVSLDEVTLFRAERPVTVKVELVTLLATELARVDAVITAFANVLLTATLKAFKLSWLVKDKLETDKLVASKFVTKELTNVPLVKRKLVSDVLVL